MRKIVTIFGPMFSNKTKSLIEAIRQCPGKPVVLKHSNDTRTGLTLSSHDPEFSDKVAAVPINSLYQISEFLEPDTTHVFVDEAQFFDPTQAVKFLATNKELNVTFVFCGLDLTFKGEPFPTMNYLIHQSDERVWMPGVCAQCGDAATHSYLKTHDKATTIEVVGGADLYEPRCQECFTIGMNP